MVVEEVVGAHLLEVCLHRCQSDLFQDKERECADDERPTLWTLKDHKVLFLWEGD